MLTFILVVAAFAGGVYTSQLVKDTLAKVGVKL